MFGLFRRQSSFGQESNRQPRSARPQRVTLHVEQLEERCTPTTFTVSNTNDNAVAPAPNAGTGTLRQAIIDSNAAGGSNTIVFAAGVAGQITLGGLGQLPITASVGIQGPGAGVITVTGNNTSRIFFSNTAGLNIGIAGLTLTGGKATGAFPTGNGGAIQENGDNLTLNSCTLTGNKAANTTGFGGGGGALYAQNGSLTVTNCTITNNTVSIRRGGGICAINCPVTIQNSTITGNDVFTGSADPGGGGGLFLKGTGVKTIQGCNISGNNANYGGGVYFKNAPAGSSMQNCTLSGNKASFNAMGNPYSGGGGAVLLYLGTLTIENCTISGNTAPKTQGGGIKVKDDTYNYPGGVHGPGLLPATLTLVSTIVSGNSDVSGPNEIQRYNNPLVIINASNDLFQTAPTAGTINGTNTANITGLNPMLGPLQNNGGPTFTEALPANSPAIDMGSNPANLATDQRGPGFSRTSGAATDIGAFEFQVLPPAITSISPTSGPTAGGTSVTIMGTNFLGVTAVQFGTTAATSFTVTSTTSITAVSPAGTGIVDITVTATSGTSATSAADQFTFTTPPPPTPPPPSATFPPPFVSVAFTRDGKEVLELVTSNGTLIEFNPRGAFQLATGVRSASVAFGPQGEIMVVVFQDGRLFQFDATGAHLQATSVLSASVALTPSGQEVLDVVFLNGFLTEYSATGTHVVTFNVRSASATFAASDVLGPMPAEVLDVVFQDGRLVRFGVPGSPQLASGVLSEGVSRSPFGQEVVDVIFADRSLFQFDATGTHKLATNV
jgi:hypothetical protein